MTMLNKYIYILIIVLVAALGGSLYLLKNSWEDVATLEQSVEQLTQTVKIKEAEAEAQHRAAITARKDKDKIRRSAELTKSMLKEALNEKDCANTTIGDGAYRVLINSDNHK